MTKVNPFWITAHANGQVLRRYLHMDVYQKGGVANPAASASNATCLTDQSVSAIGMIANSGTSEALGLAVRMHSLDFPSLAAISQQS
jgi:hypothetical protein